MVSCVYASGPPGFCAACVAVCLPVCLCACVPVCLCACVVVCMHVRVHVTMGDRVCGRAVLDSLGACLSVCFVCHVLSGHGLID